MAATSEYPVTKGRKLVRGDPLTIRVVIRKDKVALDVSNWEWRAHVRRGYDGALLMEFAIAVDTPSTETVPCRVLMSLTGDQTRTLKTGNVFDLEQLTADATPTTVRTWWIATKISVQPDVSHA